MTQQEPIGQKMFQIGVLSVLFFLIGALGAIAVEATNRYHLKEAEEPTQQPVQIVIGDLFTYDSIKHIPASAPQFSEECHLSESQLDAVRFSYEYGADYDFGYTLAAIALKESNAGKWKVNIQDPSGGLYHVTVDKVLRHNGWDDTSFNRNRAMQQLIDNDELAAELAVKELEFWRDVNSGQWMSIWASYNAGGKGMDSDRGTVYAEDIRELVNKVQQCRWVV